MSERMLLNINELKPLPMDKLAGNYGLDADERLYLKRAAKAHKDNPKDVYLAFLLRTMRRDLTYYRVCNLALSDACSYGRSHYDRALDDRTAAAENVEAKMRRIEMHMKSEYAGL